MTPELRTYNFQKPLGGENSGEVIRFREDTVAVDLGKEIVKVSKAEFWDHVRGEVESLVIGKEYTLNALLGGTAFWTPIWESPSWEGPEIVIQDRDKNLKRILLEEFWEYVRFAPYVDDFSDRTWYHKIFLFAEVFGRSTRIHTWKGSKNATDQGLATVSTLTAEDSRLYTRGRFLRAVEANTRLPAPSGEVMDSWLHHCPALRSSSLIKGSLFNGADVIFGVGNSVHFVLARNHHLALTSHIEKVGGKIPVKPPPDGYISRCDYGRTDYYSDPAGPAYDSNHYESPGGNPGSTGNHGIPGDMTR